MSIIVKMPPHLANMIAAGEVVERPSSVIKELVENSIDAKATSINIYLENGGIDLMKVQDDGIGMDSDDVLNAFLPHATSKIKTEYDLSRISTLGFRGEAISSIAAVSKCQIISSQDGIKGYECTYKSGVKQTEGIINSNKGTTVIVNNLFFNTPARLKYLKSAKTELSSIMFYVNRIAASKKNIRFKVYSDNKLIFQTNGTGSYQNLIGEIYGLESAKLTIERQISDYDFNANLVIVKPQIYRSNKLEVTLIINGRYVKNYNITNAICDGFKTYLPINKYPICLLYLEVDPTLVDVNIHPRKTEVKLSIEDKICQILPKEIALALKEEKHIPTRIINTKPEFQKQTIFEVKEEIREHKPTYEEKILNNEPKETFVSEPKYSYNSSNTKKLNEEINDSFIIKEEPIIQKEEPKVQEEVKEASKIEEKTNEKLPYMEYVGQVFGTYLIFQNNDGMYLMDQHAAAERINYEKYYQILSESNQEKTELIVPIVLTFTPSEALYINDHLDEFLNVGFRLEQIGQNDFAIRELPLWAHIDNIDDIIYDILAMMIDKRTIDIMVFRDYICKQISCKSSIKANHRINLDEVKALIDGLNNCKNPYTCPHGRPTIIKFRPEDLEKMFERIQK